MKRTVLFAMLIAMIFSSMAYARSYTIGTHHWIGFSPNDVAHVKGFWKAQGLDVELVNFTSERDACNALINKRVDIAYQMMGTWIGFYMEGLPITLIAEVDWSHGGDKVIVKKDSDINKLKGQPFGVYVENPAVLFFLNKYLEKNGMKLPDVRIVGGLEAKELADSFIFNRLKGLVLYNPQALRAEKEGNGKVVGTTASYPGCMPEGVAVRTDRLKDIPREDFYKIFKGWIDAADWIRNKANWEEYKKILNSKTFEGEAPYSDQDITEMYEGVRIHDIKMLQERNKDGGGLSLWLKEARTMLKDSGRLTKDFDPDKIFDNTAITGFLKAYR
ncbi:ABC transporter substrate-binding protein [Desulfococcaceae bacterium HSG8]|nr:ABC transporter substrate-binding protein [Desulfococcaceae bacterium HSG8]